MILDNHLSNLDPDRIPSGWLRSKYQLTNKTNTANQLAKHTSLHDAYIFHVSQKNNCKGPSLHTYVNMQNETPKQQKQSNAKQDIYTKCAFLSVFAVIRPAHKPPEHLVAENLQLLLSPTHGPSISMSISGFVP